MVYDQTAHWSLWKEAISYCVRKLKALQKVSISLEFRNYHSLPFYGDSTSIGKSRGNDLVSTICGLKRLPLKTAAIVISDEKAEQDCIRHEMMDFWTHERYSLDQKRKWARDLEKIILQSIC